MTSLSYYFNSEYLRNYYIEKLKRKKGGGRDGLTSETFWIRYEHELEDIAEACRKGTYRFSPYNERLVLKGRGKLPRVISVPSFRDRLVLGVLHEYLKTVFESSICHAVPNQLITEICDFLSQHRNEEVDFYKFDFHDFYGTIDHDILESKLCSRVESSALKLVMHAISTPTVCGKPTADEKKFQTRGVPQGLAVSNLLASIYMMEFDDFFLTEVGQVGFYCRYVDDILLLDSGVREDFRQLFQKKSEELNLQLSREKTSNGRVGEKDVDYIGYVIKNHSCVSIRSRNVQNLLARVARLLCLFKQQDKFCYLRPKFLKESSDLVAYYIELLNEELSGFKDERHLYGWMPYFQSMTDVQLLYSLDSVIHRKLLRAKGIPREMQQNVYHLPEVYWDIKKHGGKNFFLDLSEIKNPIVMKAKLEKLGLIGSNYDYTDDDINRIFERYKEQRRNKAMLSIGKIS